MEENIRLLKEKLTRLQELQTQEKEISEACKQNLELLTQKKKEVEQFIEEKDVDQLEVSEMKLKCCVLESHQNRKPTLEDAYRAIEENLGPQALAKVKEEVKQLREERKQRGKQTQSLWVRKVGEARKKRKDAGTKKKKDPSKSPTKQIRFVPRE